MGNISVSDKAQCSLGALTKEVPLYSHWLALKMYEVYCDAKVQLLSRDEDITLTVDGESFQINRDDLASASEEISVASRDYMHWRAVLSEDECTFTALMSRSLDRFIFSDSSRRTGAVLHGLPSRKRTTTSEKAAVSISHQLST